MAVNLWELQRDLNLKDAASSTEGTMWSSVNYLHYLMNGSRFERNQEDKANVCMIYDVFTWMKTLL